MIVLVAVLLVLLVQPNFQSTSQSSFFPSPSPLHHTPYVTLEQVIHCEVKYFCYVTRIVSAICKIVLNDTLLKANKTPNQPTKKKPPNHTKKTTSTKKKISPADFQNSVDYRSNKNGREGRDKYYWHKRYSVSFMIDKRYLLSFIHLFLHRAETMIYFWCETNSKYFGRLAAYL